MLYEIIRLSERKISLAGMNSTPEGWAMSVSCTTAFKCYYANYGAT